MAFECFTSSYAHGLRRTFDRVSSNPTSQKLQPPPRGCMGPEAAAARLYMSDVWSEAYDDEGNLYYYHNQTGETACLQTQRVKSCSRRRAVV